MGQLPTGVAGTSLCILNACTRAWTTACVRARGQGSALERLAPTDSQLRNHRGLLVYEAAGIPNRALNTLIRADQV